MNTFYKELVRTLVDNAFYNTETPELFTADSAKEAIEDYVDCGNGFNSLLACGDYLSSVPVELPLTLMQEACQFAWDTVDWSYIADEANSLIIKEVEG